MSYLLDHWNEVGHPIDQWKTTSSCRWDAATGREVLTIKGHSHWVTSVAFSPDDTRIVSGSGDAYKPGAAIGGHGNGQGVVRRTVANDE